MNLNWFSPLPPAKTDIAHYTARILPALKTHASVTLWTDQKQWDDGINDLAEVRRYDLDRMPWAELNRADMSIYNIGNNPIFHGAMWEASQRQPGVVVLHDYHLHELFYNLYLGRWADMDAYLTQVEFYHGEVARREAEACFKERGRTLYSLAERYPLTLLALENAVGALVHTEEALNKLKNDGPCPVIYAPLPFVSTSHSQQGVQPNPLARAEKPPFRLIVFGYISRNRRLEELLKALARFDEKDQFHLDVYGELPEQGEARRLSRLLHLEKFVTFHGFVPEAELDHALALAHLAINLRYPTMGEASGSQLRILSHALPSLVTRVGWYATLPRDAVAFVRPAHEVEDIRHHLKAFLSDPGRFATMGRRGFTHYRQYHLPEKYAEAIVRLVSAAEGFRAAASIQKLILKTRSEMERWVQRAPLDEVVIKTAAKNARLIYGRSIGGVGAPAPPGTSLTSRIKRLIKRWLPRRIYAYLKAQRERLRAG